MRRAWLIPLALLAALVWPVVTSQTKTTAQEEPPPPATEPGATDADGAEVLTRGPIHEAFAEPVTEPEPTLVVKKQPPEDIDEVLPEYAPEGEAAIWIKGYWAWDDERENFIWISGVHRVSPPGMRWVAGYWAEVEGGWQWNRGFWTSTESEELSYRDPPPETLEEGPSSPSPGDDYFYVPGNWGYYETNYRWSPGYWTLHRPNWCWVPARWVWTPRGCIYLPGYWDYAFARRGLCYAPVYFHRPIYHTPGWHYRPWCGLNTGNLFVHFWVRPNYCHYYFGNYYGIHDDWGLSPWHSYYGGWRHYDPILSFNVCHFRLRGINYVDRIGGWHRYYDRHVDERPPITFADQRRLATKVNINNITQINNITNVSVKQNFLAGNVSDLAKMETTPVKLTKLNQEQLRRAEQRAKEVSTEIKEVRQQRREIERLARAERPDVDAKGEKGADVDAKGRIDAEARAKGRVDARAETRAKLKLPQSRVAVEQPKVDVPERPDRARGNGQARRGGPAGEKGGKGPDRSARTPDGEKGTKGERPARVNGKGRPEADAKRPERPRTDKKGPERPGADTKGPERPDADTKGPERPSKARPERPAVDRPDRPGANRPEPPETPDADRGSDRPRPGPRVERPEGGRPDRGPGPDAGTNRPEPRVDRPEPGPRVERPEPKVDRPEPRVERPQPRVERPEPKVDRPEPRVERPQPRVERPQPRVERPEPRVERPASQPRVERSAPRVERSSPPPRVERSSPPSRVERPSRSESRPARSTGSSRGRNNRDRD